MSNESNEKTKIIKNKMKSLKNVIKELAKTYGVRDEEAKARAELIDLKNKLK